MLSTYDGHRPGAMRPWGRILAPDLATPVRVLMPSEDQMTDLWRAVFQIRKKPIALVMVMVGMFIIASDARARRPTRWSPVPGPIANLRRLIGAPHGGSFARRFGELETAGLISRECGLTLAPPSKWVVRSPETPTRTAPASIEPPPTVWHDGDRMPEDYDPQWVDNWL